MYCICRQATVEIMPELNRNILILATELILKMKECKHTPLIDFM